MIVGPNVWEKENFMDSYGQPFYWMNCAIRKPTWFNVSARLWMASENMEWDPVIIQANNLAPKLAVLIAMADITTLPDSPLIDR